MQLVGCSSIAAGSDTLFAEECQSLGIPWIAWLPFAADEFRQDFDAQQWSHVRELLARTIDVRVSGTAHERDAAYLECGLQTVESADLLIAVWDGMPARGLGGTGDVVAFARSLGLPLVLVEPEKLIVTRENFSEPPLCDPVIDELNAICSESDGVAPAASNEAKVRRFFNCVATVAGRIAPRYRRWIGASIIMSGTAAVLSAAQVTFNLHTLAIQIASFVLLVVATGAVLTVRLRRTHHRWIRCRIAAEFCRSALATWQMPELVTPVWFDQLQGFTGLAKTLRLLRLTCTAQRPENAVEVRDAYLHNRVEHQINYFRRRADRLHVLLRIFGTVFWLFSAGGIARIIFVAFGGAAHLDPASARLTEAFLPIAVPLAAGFTLSLMSVFDLRRQFLRCREMERQLTSTHEQIAACENFVTLHHAVQKTEDLFAAEFFEWFTLFKHPRFR